MAKPLIDLYTVRDGVPEDKNFVLATFLRGLYYGDTWFTKIPKDIFMDNYKQLAEALLTTGLLQVACLKEDSSIILGYSLLSSDYSVIHWVYVKKTWRAIGIGKALTPQHPSSVSHLSELGELLLKKYPNTVFNPFKLK